MPPLTRCLAIAAVCVPLLAGVSAAQRVRGAVVMADGATPAAGLVVVASDARGAAVMRTLTGGDGRFELRMPAAGTYEVSALRIGYRPTTVPSVVVADSGVVSVRIVLSSASVSLARVDVRSDDVCGTAGDPQSKVVEAWTAAQTVLAAAALWSREPLEAEWITYRRELAAGTDFVRSQEVRTTRNRTTHAFQSLPADSLAARGYMRNAEAGPTFYAPDPDVLLSGSFAETHCFHLEPPPSGNAGLIGVGFRPQQQRDDRVEIRGTLWIDRASWELRWLDYRYVGLREGTNGAEPGGRVEFLRLADGPWMIGRWHIRLPMTGFPTGPMAARGYASTIIKSGAPALTGISVGGGMLARVRRGGQLLYAAPGSGVWLQLVSSDTAVPVAGALVQLEGTDYSWRADSSGLVRAAPVLDGRYRVRISTVDMLALKAPPLERMLVVAPTKTRLDSVTAPSAREVVRDACGADAVRDGMAALLGVVRSAADRPAAGRAVTVSWQGAPSVRPGRVVTGSHTIGTMTDDAGAWFACDVPRARAVTVRAAADEGEDAVEVTVPETQWLARVTLRLRASAPRNSSDVASLEIVVRDAAGMGLGGTAIELTAATGEQRRVITDARGRLLVVAFPPGLTKVRARRADFQTGDVLFSVLPGRNTVPLILGHETLPTLDTVRVAGNRRMSSRLDGFETRRMRREATVSYAAADVARRAPAELSDLLRTVMGVQAVDSLGVRMAMFTRGVSPRQRAGATPCVMKVMLDGVLLAAQAGINVARPADVVGFEVFTSPLRAPAGLGLSAQDMACGLIAIHTRTDPK